mgnify:CR=1 FL=1
MLAAILGLLSLTWFGIRHTSWLGPFLADTGRSVFGPAAVARIEETVYAVEERWNRAWHGNDPPRTHWTPPADPSTAPPPVASSATASVAAFPPGPVGPMHPRFGPAGDGAWTALPDARSSASAPAMFKTQIHPDAGRPFAVVAVVAIDLSRVEVHLEPGVYVPEATEPEARGMVRSGLIPAEHQNTAMAAFNGGFKTEHGRLGMHVRGVTIVSARSWGCTVARTRDGRILLDTWSELEGDPSERVWWRQTPQCLVRNREFGDGVLIDENKNWGTSIRGGTFIRRSAIGLDRFGGVLFMGIGDPVSAGGIARAMRHAGAVTVGQLDVNWSLPKFLLFVPSRPGSDTFEARPLFPGLIYFKGEYLRDPSSRDFFYLTPKRSGE